MKKIVFLCLALLVLACGCGKPAAEVPALPDLAAQLHDAGTFSTEITPVDNSVAMQVYYLESSAVEEAVFYFSSGASADELALVKATSEDAAKEILSAFEQRVILQSESYADYMPDEVPKLEDAVVRREGVYVLLCVAEDADGVVEVMDNYF